MIVGNVACHIEIDKEVTWLFQFVEMQLNTTLLHKKTATRVSHEVDSEIVVQSNSNIVFELLVYLATYCLYKMLPINSCIMLYLF